MHQVCSSMFMNYDWLKLFQMPYELQHILDRPITDNRKYGASFYLNLKSLCLLANTTIKEYQNQFYDQQLISSHLMNRNEFEFKLNKTIDELRRKMSVDAIRILEVTRVIMHGNQYVSGYFTSWQYQIRPDYTMPLYPVPSQPVLHGANCSCATSSQCFENAFFIDWYTDEIFFVPGILIGCLLRSTLECLYSQSCVDRMMDQYLFYLNTRQSPLALNQSIPSQFQPNNTVNELFHELFIEEYSAFISYDNYYSQCAPTYCSYTIAVRAEFFDIAITMLGVYGGLVIVLRLMITCGIRILSKIYQRRIAPHHFSRETKCASDTK
ncbi:unnamed protein product [Rotaria sp. Silwood1]|nr:unnamed protein product [Rotaria sp. Silwood1]